MDEEIETPLTAIVPDQIGSVAVGVHSAFVALRSLQESLGEHDLRAYLSAPSDAPTPVKLLTTTQQEARWLSETIELLLPPNRREGTLRMSKAGVKRRVDGIVDTLSRTLESRNDEPLNRQLGLVVSMHQAAVRDGIDPSDRYWRVIANARSIVDTLEELLAKQNTEENSIIDKFRSNGATNSVDLSVLESYA